MYFITGCTGLVGSHIARKLLAEGHKVSALKRTSSDLSMVSDIYEQIDWIDGDILDIDLLNQWIPNGANVIHAAAMVSFDPKDRKDLFKINVEGTANMVNVCLDKDIRHFLLVSSVGSLGRQKGQTHIEESAQWVDSKLNTHYAYSKYLSEVEVWRGIAEGLPAVIINPSVVLGVGDWNKSSLQLFKYVHDQKPFYATGSINTVDVRDVAEVVYMLIDRLITGERFVLSGLGTSYLQLFEKIAFRFGVKAPFKKVTPMIATLSWMVSKAWSFLTGQKPLITKETALLSRLTYYYKSDKVRNTLGFEFRSIEETLDWACKELKLLNT